MAGIDIQAIQDIENFVAQRERPQQLVGFPIDCALERGNLGQQAFEPRHILLPGGSISVDLRQIPGIISGNFIATWNFLRLGHTNLHQDPSDA